MSDVRSLLSRKNLTIPEALRPTFVNGKWRSPVLTPRKAKKLRKHMLICGESWDDDWLINSGKMTVMRVPKGHKRDLIREDRVDMILKRLDGMDEKIKLHRKAVRDRKPRIGFREELGYKMPSSS